MTALILAGHGSHVSPYTAGLVWRYVDQLRALEVADEITACFWKEMPAFRHVLDTVESEDIIIVPVFTAQGYFSGTVIPSEMNLTGQVTHQNGRTITLTPTIGEHPYLETIVRQRVTDIMTAEGLSAEQVTIAIIGHGTKRNPTSRDATRYQAAQLRQQQLSSAVLDAYLDDDPAIPTIYKDANTQHIIAVPFFLAPGSHVTIDVPNALGIEVGAELPITTQINGHTLYYTPPVGTDDAICQLIMELVADVKNDFPHRPVYKAESHKWQPFPTAGRDTFNQTLQREGRLVLGQLEITHKEVKPIDAPSSAQCVPTIAELREIVRANPFRPLATSNDLPNNWRVLVDSFETLHAVIETVYPGAIAEWTANQNGTFNPESLEAVCESQTGMFAGLHQKASQEEIEDTVTSVCSNCVCHPTWHDNLVDLTLSTIPCKSPCNVWLSHLAAQLKEAVL